MDILNNHQIVKTKGRIFFHYRIDDQSFLKQNKNAATIDYYSIAGNDLILTHENYYDEKFVAIDTLRDWRLINVDMTDCDPEKLSRLADDRGIKEIKIIEMKKGKKLIFYSYTGGIYTFKCEAIEQEIRGHSRKEIVDMLLEKEEYVNEVEIQNSKFYEFVIRLHRFVNGETRDHRNLLELNQNKDILLATKSGHYLEILARVKDKLEDLFKDLPEDMLKYRGILM